jgi:hypothetical protein
MKIPALVTDTSWSNIVELETCKSSAFTEVREAKTVEVKYSRIEQHLAKHESDIETEPSAFKNSVI